MIDLHTHILPGIDDGAESMEESIKMARIAYASGVRTLVVTPHCNRGGSYDNYYDERLGEHYNNFVAEVKKEKVPITILLGMEVYGDEEVPNLLHSGRLATINQSRYLLLEFAFEEGTLLMDYLINEVLNLGYIPIIAHPERYLYVQRHPDIISRWISQGCLIQVNKGSILGNFGFNARNTAMFLLEYNMVTVIASDAHSHIQRTTDLSRVYYYIKSMYSYEYAELLFQTNPKRILANEDLIKPHHMRMIERTHYI